MVYKASRVVRGFVEREKTGETEPHTIPVDIYETQTMLRIEFEMAGIKKEDIEAYVMGNRLFVKALKWEQRTTDDPKESTRNYICFERQFGKFYREVELPIPCDTSKGKAMLKAGVLLIEFPKIEDKRGQRKDIKIEEQED